MKLVAKLERDNAKHRYKLIECAPVLSFARYFQAPATQANAAPERYQVGPVSPPYHRGKFSSWSAAVKNPQNADLKQHQSPLYSHGEPRLSRQPMNWEVDNHQSSHFERQQQPPALQIPPYLTTGWQMPSKSHNGKDSHVELPQELISFFRIIKSLL